jgi:hypothetical protein
MYSLIFYISGGNSPNWLQNELEIPSNLDIYRVVFEGNLTSFIWAVGGITLGI